MLFGADVALWAYSVRFAFNNYHFFMFLMPLKLAFVKIRVFMFDEGIAYTP